MTGTEVATQWEDQLAKYAKEQADKEKPSLQYMSLKAGVMMLNGVQVDGNKIEVVVLASAFTRTFYSERWDPDVRANPACFSVSVTGQDMTPHPDVSNPINPTCRGCKYDAWESDPHNKKSKGKGCKEKRRLGFIPKKSLLDGNVKNAELAVLSLPVTSVKNWANYVNLVAAEFRRPTWAVVTEISVVPDPKSQFKVLFKPTGSVDDNGVLGELSARIPATEELLLTPYDEEAPPPEKTGTEEPSKKKKY